MLEEQFKAEKAARPDFDFRFAPKAEMAEVAEPDGERHSCAVPPPMAKFVVRLRPHSAAKPPMPAKSVIKPQFEIQSQSRIEMEFVESLECTSESASHFVGTVAGEISVGSGGVKSVSLGDSKAVVWAWGGWNGWRRDTSGWH